MNQPNTLKIVFLILLWVQFSFTNAQSSTFTLEDINEVVDISGLSMSPDGKTISYSVIRKNMETNSRDRSLMFMDINSRTSIDMAVNMSEWISPQWMPDGKSIAYLSRGQVHIFHIATKESKMVTKSTPPIFRYVVSPDGKRVAYLCREVKEDANDGDKFNNSFIVGHNDYLVDEAPVNTQVWVADIDEDGAYQVTPDTWTVATGLSTTSLAWSNDANKLAFTVFPSSFSGDSDLGRNYIFDVISRKLIPATDNAGRESGPLFHPDNQSLLYSFPKDDFPSNMRNFYRVNLLNGKISNFTGFMDRNIYNIHWMDDGSMLMSGLDTWGNAIWHVEGKNTTKLNMGYLTSISQWEINKKGQMVILGTQKDYPEEIYFKSSLEADPVPLTSYNTFIKDFQLGKQEGITWKSSENYSPNGIITYPPDFNPSKKYPLVLYIHGGPSAASTFGFHPFVQTLASQGWIVFQPNYRGSTNLGNAFQSAISKDPSEGPGQDVMTGVQVLMQKPYIDESKICVSGWSYGGWMTSWLIGRYPDVWAAAVAGAAPVDFTDMYSLNDLNRMRRHAIVESPYVGDNLIWAYNNSPIIHFNKIKTPTLIMSKTEDSRVTITGSYKLFGALRDNNIPAQFVGYPGPGHFPSDPVRTIDVYSRWIEWLQKYMDRKDEMRP